MKAIIISNPGDPTVLQVAERPVPTPSDNEILINVKAVGVNRPDVAQRKGHYPAPPGVPADIPGLEVAGIVELCGSNNVGRWKKGDTVCALIAGGGYAQYVVANADHCLPIPSGWSFEEASSLPETVFTVWHNVFQRGHLKEGEQFLVHGGSSGIGITAIQLAKAFGAQVFATVGSDDKRNACMSLGADQCINYKEVDFGEFFEKDSVDVILDMIGSEYFSKNVNLLRQDGRLVFINAMKGHKADLNIFDIMKKRLTITGSTLRTRNALFKASLAREIETNVWPLLVSRKFKPIIYRQFLLEEAAQAHSLMETSEHIGKIVLTT